MTYTDDCTSDTSSISSSLAPSQLASQCVSQTSDLSTNLPRDTASVFRRARTVRDQLRDVDEANLLVGTRSTNLRNEPYNSKIHWTFSSAEWLMTKTDSNAFLLNIVFGRMTGHFSASRLIFSIHSSVSPKGCLPYSLYSLSSLPSLLSLPTLPALSALSALSVIFSYSPSSPYFPFSPFPP
jgi:hypothetical protein